MSVVDFMSCCLRDLDSIDIAILFYTAWTLWLARNELKWEGKVNTVADICNQAAGLAIAFLEAGGVEDVPNQPVSGGVVLDWSPPPLGCYKVSIACHFRSVDNHTRVGILIRDHVGLVVATFGFVLPKFNDHLLTHSYVVFYALQLDFETSFHRDVEFEVPS
jgi:hypothetical protein